MITQPSVDKHGGSCAEENIGGRASARRRREKEGDLRKCVHSDTYYLHTYGAQRQRERAEVREHDTSHRTAVPRRGKGVCVWGKMLDVAVRPLHILRLGMINSCKTRSLCLWQWACRRSLTPAGWNTHRPLFTNEHPPLFQLWLIVALSVVVTCGGVRALSNPTRFSLKNWRQIDGWTHTGARPYMDL